MPASGNSLPECDLRFADQAAFTNIFRRYYGPLVRYARRITGDAASAADVLQDVFLKLWENRETLMVKVSLQALLYTMVRNQALKANRHRQHIATGVTVEEAYDLHHTVPSGEATMDAEALRRRLYAWIDALPPRRAEAFVLSRYHGLTHSEIAAIMGVSARTVETHIVLALRELRHRLDALQKGDQGSPEGISP